MKIKFILIILCPYLSIAQPQHKYYSIGDTLPLQLMQDLYPANTTSYKPLTLINLTTLQCKNSRSYMPGFTELAQRFNNDVQFLQVTDKALDAHFNYVLTPHIVWVNATRKIIAVTDGDYVNEQHIQKMLEGDVPAWPVKTEDRHFNYNTAVMSAKEHGITSQYYTAVTPRIKYAISKYVLQRDSAGHTTRMAMYNKRILSMYLLGIGKPITFPKSHVLLQVDKKENWVQPKGMYDAEWNEHNTYCYETVVQGLQSANVMLKGMLDDLDRAFNVTSFYGTKEVDCYQLVLTDKGEKLKSKGGVFKNTLYTKDSTRLLQNGKIADLLWELNNTWLNWPVTDATGYSGGIDMVLELEDFTQNKNLEMQLAKHGLALKPAKMQLEVLEIKHNSKQ